MNINFELYKVFYEVAIHGSISKGAESLMISQPAVTQSIKTLENELGGKLFIRTPKGVTLTDEGKELFKYIKEGMTYFINGANKFNSLKNLTSGSINIGASTVISEYLLMPYIIKFHELFPNIEINITNDLTDNLIKGLRNGSLDIVINSKINRDIKDMKIFDLCEVHDIFVGSNKFKDSSYNLQDLLNEGILIQMMPSVTRNNFEEFIKYKNLSFNTKMEVVSHSLLTKLVENNFGIGLLTKEFIVDKLDKSLFEINVNTKVPSRKICYMIKNDTYPSFSVKKFMELLKKED
mgnify:CR=1 FL=1